MSNNVIELTSKEIVEFRQLLIDEMNLHDPLHQDVVINQVIREGSVNTCGFGSLIKTPFHKDAQKYDAVIEGYNGVFGINFDLYGGHEDAPSLMYGAEKQEGASLPGVLSKDNIFGNKEPSFDLIKQYFQGWKDREAPPRHGDIYNFPFVEVTRADGIKELAFICETNKEGERYVGDYNELSLMHRAAIICMTRGKTTRVNTQSFREDPNTTDRLPLSPHQQSSFSYLMELYDARKQKGFPIDDDLEELMETVKVLRWFLDSSKLDDLYVAESGKGSLRGTSRHRNLEGAFTFSAKGEKILKEMTLAKARKLFLEARQIQMKNHNAKYLHRDEEPYVSID